MTDSSKEAKARAEARFKAVAKKQETADGRSEERRAAETAQDDKTARLKAQRLAKHAADGEAADAAQTVPAEALKRKPS